KQVDAVMSFVPFDGFCDVLKTCRIAVFPAKGEGPKVLTDLNGAGGLYVMRREYMQKNPAATEGFSRRCARPSASPQTRPTRPNCCRSR
ncbi:MAG: hypothetical protein RR574_15075, partial [Comamonas sp.]